MAFMPDDEIIYLQYLIFYESLEEQYAPAANLYEHVLEELDEVGDTLGDIEPASYEDQEQTIFDDTSSMGSHFSNVSVRNSYKDSQGHNEAFIMSNNQSVISESDYMSMAESVKSGKTLLDSNGASLRSSAFML